MKKIAFILLVLLCNSSLLSAQHHETALLDSIVARFDRQLHHFPQEKIHLHTDRSHYVVGETVWFRAFLVNALTHAPDTSSRYVYVELIDPADSVAARYMILHQDGVYSGYIPLAESLSEGNYMLRAYTRYMAHAGEDYFFHKPIRISDPLSGTIRTEAVFTTLPNQRQTNLDLGFYPTYEPGKALPVSLRASFNGGEAFEVHPERDSVSRFSVRPDPTRRKNLLLIDYDKHRQYLEVPSPEDQFDVSFFPEGGYLIPGKPMLIGVKALKPNGQAEEVSGEIKDPDGNTVATFKTLHMGVGTLRFMPAPGVSYTAHCTNAAGHTNTFVLPGVREDAVSLQLGRTRKLVVAGVSAGPQASLQPYNLVIHARGLVYQSAEIPSPDSPVYIETESLLPGVNHFLLLDPAGRIVSERLVFILHDNLPSVVIETNKGQYARREQVRASLSVLNNKGESLNGSFSIAVTDNNDIAVDSSYTILSSLLLSSELKGFIEDPGFYLDLDNPLAVEAAEGLMLTQGWRKYDIPNVLQGDIQRPSSWHEDAVRISGRAKRPLGSGGSVHTPVYLLSPQYGYFEMTETDDDGRFRFSGMDIPDSTSFIIQALNRRGGNFVELSIDPFPFPEIFHSFPSQGEVVKPSKESEYITKADQQWTLENGMRMIYIDEITVTAKRRITAGQNVYNFTTASLSWLDFEENNIYSLEQALRQTPGVAVEPSGRVSMSGIGGRRIVPKVFIDGIEIENFTTYSVGFGVIERIDVVNASDAPFASLTGGAVVFIQTKDGRSGPPPINQNLITPLGYQLPVEFYSPKYETAAQREDRTKPDLRTTIYWNPDVRTDTDGQASFGFYAGDNATTYSIVIEGVTDDGQIVRAVETIRRE